MDEGTQSVLLVHHRDLSSPIGSTLSYYVSNELAESHPVHVVCRKRTDERSEDSSESAAVLHAIDTGDVPLLSTIVFHLAAVLYVSILAATRRFDVVYSFQSSIIQGWIGSRIGGSRFVIGLASAPVRQSRDFSEFSNTDTSIQKRLSMTLLGLYSRVVGVLLGRSSEVICLTAGIRDVTAEFYGVDLSDAHVIGMGVDAGKFAFSGGAKVSGRSDEWTVTYVGTVRETRNLEQVLEAVAALEYDVRFRIAGQGTEEDVAALLEQAEELGVSERVEWLGLVPHEEIPRLLSTSDFSISPLPDIESYRVSFPAKLLEYMAAGSVVVATDLPAHRTLIDDGTNGYLYDGSRDELVATIQRCIENEADLSDVRRRARATAETHDWDVVVRKHEAVIFGTRDRAEGLLDPQTA